MEQKRERRQKSPTRNAFDPLPTPPGSRGGQEQVDQKTWGSRQQQKEKRSKEGRKERRQRGPSAEDDRPPPGTVLAAKQSYLHKAKPPEAPKLADVRAEVTLYNEGQSEGPKISERVKVDVHNFVSETSGAVRRPKSPAGPAPQQPAVAIKEKAVIKELREKVEGKQGKISKFAQRGSAQGGREERRREPVGSDNTGDQGREGRDGREGRPAKPKRTTSEAASRLEVVAEEGRGQNRARVRRPEVKQGKEERAQRSRSVGHLEEARAREEEEQGRSRGLRRSKSRGSRDQLDGWEEVDDQRRSRSRSKSISRSRGEILDVTPGPKRQEPAVRPSEATRGPPGQAFSRRQFLMQSGNLHPPPSAHHLGFLSPYVSTVCAS